MRCYCYRLLIAIVVLVFCLMFAPGRRLTGTTDFTVDAAPIRVAEVTSATRLPMSFAEMCKNDPVVAIEESLKAYRAQIEGYSCIFEKQELIKDKLKSAEVIAVDFQESPFSFLMRWQAGKDRVEKMLFSRGENEDNLLIVPAGETARNALKLIGKFYAKRTLDSADAKAAARLPADQFGIYNAGLRVRDAWSKAQEANQLKVEYLGEQTPREIGRKCYVLHRKINPPEQEGLTDVWIYLDAESKLQLGTELKAGEKLLGRYFYRDLKINPPFKADHFKPDALKKS